MKGGIKKIITFFLLQSKPTAAEFIKNLLFIHRKGKIKMNQKPDFLRNQSTRQMNISKTEAQFVNNWKNTYT